MSSEKSTFRITHLGDSALLFDAAEAKFDDACQAKIWSMADRIMATAHVLEAVPGMNNLMVVFDVLKASHRDIEQSLSALWLSADNDAVLGPIIDVPTVYGGSSGEDLIEFAKNKNLTMREVVEKHSSAVYTVAAVGAMPGFVYLSGLDPALATPRRNSPRMNVAKGSVIIGGSQAGIMPVTAPSGWHILGHTDLVLFDPLQTPPAFFKPGDRVRFVVERIIE